MARPRILLVDDDKNNLHLLKKIVSPYGRVEITDNGHVAMAKFQAALEQGDPFQMVFLDIMMPQINGRTLLRQIRDHEAIWGNVEEDQTVVVMASGIKDRSIIDQMLREGSEFYMTKPFRVEQVEKIMKRLHIARIEREESTDEFF